MIDHQNDTASWTFMVYLAGDNNLSQAGDRDLEEMRQVGSTDKVNVIAEFDNAGDQGTRRFYIHNDPSKERVFEMGETDSGSPEVLLSFVEWAKENYPAEHYALVLWNHGGGWEPSEIERIARGVNTVDFNLREAQERRTSSLGRVFFRTTLEKIYSLPSVAERAIASDDGSGHSLDTIELGGALRGVEQILGKKLDLLGMDACLMSNLEVAYQAQPYVEYIVASEENEPNDGWPYDAVLKKLVEEPGTTTGAFAEHIVNAYVQSYEAAGYSGVVTQSALHLAQIDQLVEPLDALGAAITQHFPRTRREIGEALYNTTANFWHGTLWDVAQFAFQLARETDNHAVKTAAQAVRRGVYPINKQFVAAEKHMGEKVQRCGGVTIYLPPRILHKVSPFYGELAYAKEHRWSQMLQAYHGA